MKYPLSTLAVLAVCAFASAPALAEDYVITLKDQKFTPDTLTIPADIKVKVTVKNEGKKPAEFESNDLNREKVIAAGTEATLFIGPLSAGSYSFFDDFHEETKGTIIVK